MSAPASAPVEIVHKPIRVVYVRPVYAQDHKILSEVCQICQKNVEQRCNRCSLVDTASCPIKIGECNHGFHAHCLETWLETNKKCPVDMATWKER
jgi:hypothetical protein